jgi:hypothetical protein
MSAKQDRTYARTAQDIERKYQFGKTFAEMLGLINDNRDKVDSVESSLRSEITESETSLKRTAHDISMEVSEKVRTELSDSIAGVDASVSELESKVKMKLDADAVTIEVQKEIAKGVDRVVTKTGYEFGDSGLNISKSGEEMSNLLDHTGMYVKRDDKEILTANNIGVATENLHTRKYLIIGENGGRSRFEDYGIDRTACFWVGD